MAPTGPAPGCAASQPEPRSAPGPTARRCWSSATTRIGRAALAQRPDGGRNGRLGGVGLSEPSRSRQGRGSAERGQGPGCGSGSTLSAANCTGKPDPPAPPTGVTTAPTPAMLATSTPVTGATARLPAVSAPATSVAPTPTAAQPTATPAPAVSGTPTATPIPAPNGGRSVSDGDLTLTVKSVVRAMPIEIGNRPRARDGTRGR